MAFRTQKISQMTPKGSDLEATDLIEVSTIESGSYVTRSITGQELIDAIPLPPSGITIGTTAITSGTVGRVLFEGTGNVVQESANLFWDNTNGRLGIGTASPATTLDVNGTIKSSVLRSDVINNTANTITLLQFTGTGNRLFDNSGTQVLNLRGGNLQIGTTTDAGYRLDVNGTARVVAQNYYGTFSESGLIYSSDAVGTYASAGASLGFALRNGGGGSGRFIFTSPAKSATYSTTQYLTQLTATFNPTSGVSLYTMLELTPTINQTGGANGITRGIYIAPTLTSAPNFRAIETTAGNVIFNGGNVGIGTSSPANKLEVQGGDVRFANGLTIGTAGLTGWQFSSNTVTLIQNGFLGVDVAGGRQFSITNTAFSTTYFRIAATTGNVLINTTTDAGYKLDVNGTARVSSTLYVSNAGVGTTTAFIGGKVVIGSELTDSGYAVKIRSGNNGVAGIYLRGGGSGGYPIMFCQDYNGTASTTFIVRENGSVHVGATDNVPSSKLTLTSTTQGFLPPRMTTTQKNAIASPATGLMVYDTTLTRPCFYDGTTWITL